MMINGYLLQITSPSVSELTRKHTFCSCCLSLPSLPIHLPRLWKTKFQQQKKKLLLNWQSLIKVRWKRVSVLPHRRSLSHKWCVSAPKQSISRKVSSILSILSSAKTAILEKLMKIKWEWNHLKCRAWLWLSRRLTSLREHGVRVRNVGIENDMAVRIYIILEIVLLCLLSALTLSLLPHYRIGNLKKNGFDSWHIRSKFRIVRFRFINFLLLSSHLFCVWAWAACRYE